MRKFIVIQVVIIIVASLIFGCSSGSRLPDTKTLPQDKGNPNSNSIHFYTMGEIAYNQDDILTAYGLFRQADLADPQNISIKERILETLWILAIDDETRYDELIALAENHISRNLYSLNTLRYLGLSYFQVGKNKEGLRTMKWVLDLDPTPYNYYDYFLYLLRYGDTVDFSYLEKALEKGKNNPNILYAIAQIYEYHNPFKSKEILEYAAQTFKDEESYDRLIYFYNRYFDWYGIVDFIESLLDEGKPVEKEYKGTFLETLFFLDDYDRIIANYEHFKDDPETEFIQIIYLAAYLSENYELASELIQKLFQASDYELQDKELLYSSLATLYLLLNDFDNAAEQLMNIDDIRTQKSILFYESEDHILDIDVEEFIKILVSKGYDQDRATYLLALSYFNNSESDEGLGLLNKLSEVVNDDDDLLFNIAYTYLEHDLNQSAVEVLNKVEDPEFEPYTFIGSFYYVSGVDSLAINYLTLTIEEHDNPSTEAFLTLASLYNKRKDHDKELRIMERAVVLYPEEPLILNWFGYSLVMHTTRYGEAEEYLLKAISLEPENHYIQDSVAWLYYQTEDYEKALAYMQGIIYNGVDSSVIAYHIGMIYYKLSEKEDAKYYLLQAIEIDDDDDYRNKAEEILKELEALYEQ
ncbi:MAG: hypothetical protein K0B81_04190 [Candidatus Cloacimonetes bacterium]|nr:hypothetical protein [Candidatus Cloacimonadota bacterium]